MGFNYRGHPVRVIAIEGSASIAHRGDERVLRFVRVCADDVDKHVRAAVVRALKRIAQVGDIQVVNWLITVSITDSCFVVRDLAVEAALDLFSGPSSQLMRVWDAFPAARNREFLILQNGFLP